MGRFQSKEEYERWRAAQRGEEPTPTDADAPSQGQVYDGPPPGSEAFAARRVAQAGVVSDRERTLAMVCHLSALLGCVVPFGAVVGPLIVWLVVRKDSPFVDAHGKAALNFQISVSLTYVLLVALTLLFGLGAVAGVIILFLLSVVRVISVAASAHRGEDPAYGFGLNLIK